MISKANYGLPEDPSIKAIKKKLEIKTEEANAPILKNNLVPTKYDLGKAPLAPDASEPNVEQINSEIRTNKPAFIKSNYEEKTKSDVIGNNEKNDNSSEEDEKTKLEGESKDFVGAGLKALDFGVTVAQKSEAKGRKERNPHILHEADFRKRLDHHRWYAEGLRSVPPGGRRIPGQAELPREKTVMGE